MKPPSERFKKSLTQDNLWIYILTLLKKEPLYPYQIKNKVEKEFKFKPGNMTAYIVIKKLKVGGYIEIEKTAKDRGPNKTYYKITEKGIKELEKSKKFYEDIGKRLRWINV